jgi:hypothetical protein
MPSKKKNCYCPTCKGELRDSKTVKRHSARVDTITSAQEAQKEDYDRAQLGGDESEDEGSESYGMVDDDENLANEPEGDVEMGERPNKRRRTGDDMVGHK